MNEQFKQSGDGKLTYMPQYNYNNRKSEAPIIEVVKERPQKKSNDLSLTTKIKSFILLVAAVILVGIAGRSETDPTFPDKLLVLWSIYDLAGCMIAIVLVNVLKEVFKK
jgi:hypothetical protein